MPLTTVVDEIVVGEIVVSEIDVDDVIVADDGSVCSVRFVALLHSVLYPASIAFGGVVNVINVIVK